MLNWPIMLKQSSLIAVCDEITKLYIRFAKGYDVIRTFGSLYSKILQMIRNEKLEFSNERY